MFPIDEMAILAMANDVVLTRTVSGEQNTRRDAFYICEGCCCIFWPDNDGPGVIYPDRYTHVGIEGTHCDEDERCGCHDFPHCTYDYETDEYVVTRNGAT